MPDTIALTTLSVAAVPPEQSVTVPQIARLTFVPGQLQPGEAVTGTVTLTAPAAVDITIALAAVPPGSTSGLPATVTVPKGQSTASFLFTVTAGTAAPAITETATVQGSTTASVSGTITVSPCKKAPLTQGGARTVLGFAFFALLATMWVGPCFIFGERSDYHPLLWMPIPHQYLFQAWRVGVFILNLGLVIGLFGIAGFVVSQRVDGILIDDLNRISLSRFQAVVWSGVVLAGFATAALSNVYMPWSGAVYTQAKGSQLYKADYSNAKALAWKAVPSPVPDRMSGQVAPASPVPPLSTQDVPVPTRPHADAGQSIEPVDGLDVGIPTALYLVMGISVTTLVAAGVVTQTRKGVEGAMPTTLQQPEAVGLKNGTALMVGDVVSKPTLCDASWRDLFQGTTPDDFAHVDLNRLQNLFFTVVLATGYVAALCMTFGGTNGPIHAFPSLDTGALTILGISHAAYLAGKAAGGASNPVQNSAGGTRA